MCACHLQLHIEMTDPVNIDPTSEASRTVGSGLFEEDMGPGAAMAHLYRGEVHRMTRWRERLDRTTNWAVMVMAAILTWSFSDPANPHYLILLGAVSVGFFLGIEAHRFRGYIVWRTRVRMIQENVWAHGLDPTETPRHPNWRKELARDYRDPTVRISFEEALAHRLRRIYLAMLAIVFLAWIIRITVISDAPWPESAAIGAIPGTITIAVVVAFFLLALVIAFRPRDWKGYPELRYSDLGEWEY